MAQIAFLFAGQGAQYPGMGKALYAASPAARRVFDACEALRTGTLAQCFEGSAEELSSTINTQPCLFAMDCACAAALEEAGIRADYAAGFSLGEIAAVAFCGLLSLEDAFGLVCRRAELMAAAGAKHPGAMSAILRLSAEQVQELCGKYSDVFPVNYNCPGQTVVSGKEEQLAWQNPSSPWRLKVSGSFHSPYMQEASEGLAEYMAGLTFAAPRIPLYANATAEPYTAESAADLLAQQVKSPVLWQKSMEALRKEGCKAFAEVGAGKTLTGLMRKIDAGAAACNIESPETLQTAVSMLKGEENGK